MKMKKKTFILMLALFIASASFSQKAQDYKTSEFQFTFLCPHLSTNGFQNAHTVNKTSINLFCGLAGGVDGFEAAGFLNIDKRFVKGAQFSGFANLNGGYLDGSQFAAFLNNTKDSAKGAQFAGFLNLCGNRSDVFQAAGFANIVHGENKGSQIAGFINVSEKGTTELQSAGFANVSNNVNGAQIAGFINVAKEVKGVQIAGFINICDSIDGIPIGFINVVRKNGYRKFEVSASEALFLNLTYKMGVKQFYSIYTIGKPEGPRSRWFYGFGFGTEKDLSPKVVLNIEAIVHQELWVAKSNASFLDEDGLFLLSQLKTSFGIKLSESTQLFVGPNINVQIRNNKNQSKYKGDDLDHGLDFFCRTSKGSRKTEVKCWIGLSAGLRF
jgi:hypothetical protein